MNAFAKILLTVILIIFAVTLQRYLCPEQQSFLRMRKVCTVISNLNPFNHNKEFFDTQNPQRQHGL